LISNSQRRISIAVEGGGRSFPTTSRFRSTPPFAPLMVRPSSAEGGMSPEKTAARPDAQRPINHLDFATTELPNVAENNDSLSICYDFIGIRSGDLGEEQGGGRSFPTTSRFRSTPPFALLMVRPSSAEGGMSPEKTAARSSSTVSSGRCHVLDDYRVISPSPQDLDVTVCRDSVAFPCCLAFFRVFSRGSVTFFLAFVSLPWRSKPIQASRHKKRVGATSRPADSKKV